jgi:hypothetical protein
MAIRTREIGFKFGSIIAAVEDGILKIEFIGKICFSYRLYSEKFYKGKYFKKDQSCRRQLTGLDVLLLL